VQPLSAPGHMGVDYERRVVLTDDGPADALEDLALPSTERIVTTIEKAMNS